MLDPIVVFLTLNYHELQKNFQAVGSSVPYPSSDGSLNILVLSSVVGRMENDSKNDTV